MKILIIIDQFDGANNGTTISARRFVENLRKRGHEVRVVSTGKEDENKYKVEKVTFLPIAEKIISSQGMAFAKVDKDILKEAISWADIVHFYLPFWLSIKGMEIAKEMHKPMTAAFHVQPENITYTIGMGKMDKVNDTIYSVFKKNFFDNFRHIHCPSNFIANELIKHDYKAKMHVISNGIEPVWEYYKEDKPKEFKDKIILTMVGRLSGEKRQDLLIDAVSKSKYSDKIQLIFAGKGPKLKAYTKQGEKLKNKPIFNFYPNEELKSILGYTDLYIHTSDAEIEAISCIEAIATGLVPIIANSPKSATSQFALDDRSKFKVGDSDDLAKKIDYWLDNKEEKEKMELEYAENAKKYKIENSMKMVEEMFLEEIEDNKRDNEKKNIKNNDKDNESIKKENKEDKIADDKQVFHMWEPLKFNIKDNYKYIIKNGFVNFLSDTLFFIIAPILYLFNKVVLGFRIEGKENIKNIKGGKITISNHVHPMDCTMNGLINFPRRTYYLSLKSNFQIPVIRHIIRLLYAIPIPEKQSQKEKCMNEIEKALKDGEIVQIYPEGSLWPYCERIRNFKNGAFRMAVDANVPVIPIVYKFEEPSGIYRFYKNKKCIVAKILEPVYPNNKLEKAERIQDLKERAKQNMEDTNTEIPINGELEYVENVK